MMLTAEELSEGAFDLDRYDLLTKMAERESRIIASLMTKLRITPQSTYDQSKKEAAPRSRTALGARRGLTVKKSSTGFSVSSYLFEIYPEISFHQAGGGGEKFSTLGAVTARGFPSHKP